MSTEFKPGDKISFLNYEGSGKVISILEDDQIMIELDEGFEIPVNKGEIVKEKDFTKEASREEKKEAIEDKGRQPTGNPGVYLAFDQSKSEEVLELHVVNNTQYSLYFTIFERKGENQFKGLSRGELESLQYQMINRYNTQHFDDWPALIFQGIYFSNKLVELSAPIHYTFKPRASAFFKAVNKAPLLEHKAHLFRVDQSQMKEKSRDTIEENQEKKTSHEQETVSNIDRPPEVIDLHIEKLVPDHKEMERDSILEYQMEYFENTINKAIAHNYKRMIFIHGIGNGVLRERIHFSLKRKKEVHSFKEADPQQYGYGATEVRFGE